MLSEVRKGLTDPPPRRHSLGPPHYGQAFEYYNQDATGFAVINWARNSSLGLNSKSTESAARSKGPGPWQLFWQGLSAKGLSQIKLLNCIKLRCF